MRKSIIFSAMTATAILMSGCADMVPGMGLAPSATQTVATADIGTVRSVRYVQIKDSGTGTLVGSALGAVLGHMIGKGKGRTLATLAGGLAGAYVGNQVGKANAQELTVRLDNGRTVVVVVKGTNYVPGERVRIIRNGNKLINVQPL